MAMELEDLKKTWEERDRRLDAAIRVNTGMLGVAITSRAETAMRRLSRLLWLELLSLGVIVLWLGSFAADHVAELRFLVPAAALGICTIARAIACIRQLAGSGAIDYGAPIVAIQRRLESLRVQRIRAVTVTLLLAPLLWTPLLIVALQGLAGVDAWAVLSRGWLAANLLLGVAVIPLAVWLSRRYAERMKRSPFVQRLMRDLAGTNLAAATGFLSTLARFEAGGE